MAAEKALHTLDAKRASLTRIKPLHKKALFICYWGPKKSKSISMLSMFRWVVAAIHSVGKAVLQALLQRETHPTYPANSYQWGLHEKMEDENRVTLL